MSDLSIIKNKIKRGTISLLSKELEVSTTAIYNVLNGKSSNQRIIKALITAAEQQAQQQAEISERLKKLA